MTAGMPDTCSHAHLHRAAGPLPLYRCGSCRSGFLISSYIPVPPGRFEEVARQIVGSDKVLERVHADVEAAGQGLVLLPGTDGA